MGSKTMSYGIAALAMVGVAGAAMGGGFPPVITLSMLNGVDGFRVDAAAAGDGASRSVATGDINGDGIDDLIIGAPSADPGGRTSAGSVFVVFGRDPNGPGGAFPASVSLASLDGTNGFRLNGVLNGDAAGAAVGCAGDVNGDGVDDVIAAAPLADPNGLTLAGSVFVFFGRDTSGPGGPFPAAIELSALNGTDGFRLNGVFVVERCGNAVASAGDVNDDGVDDVIIGAEGSQSGGRAYVVLGRDVASAGAFPAVMTLSSLNGMNGFILTGGSSSDQAGASVACAGDINGDGVDDVMVGARGAAPGGVGNAGTAYVFYGRDPFGSGGAFPATTNLGTLNGINGCRFDGAEQTGAVGRAVSSAGDLNGDGKVDLAIGAPSAAPGGVTAAGSIFVVYGLGAGGMFPPATSLATIDGANGFRLNGSASFEQVGFSLASDGDVNGDGIDDLVTGAPGSATMSPGQAFVLFGRDGSVEGGAFPAVVNVSEFDGTNGFRMNGQVNGDATGDSVAAGDVNGDGATDALISAFQFQVGTGRTYVVYGQPGSAPCPGDVNGDGEVNFTDLNIVLADYNSTGSNLPGDTDDDGDVDFADLNTVLGAYNVPCP